MAEPQSNADLDLTQVSRDSANSTTKEYRPDDLDADAGPHAVETPGAPKDDKPAKKAA